MPWFRRAGVAVLLLAAALAVNAAGADPLAIWKIVHNQCVPAAQKGEPLRRPCLQVDLAGGDAVIKDLIGVAQLLLIPTARVTGIEDPSLLRPDAPNYFAAAWRARSLMTPLLKSAPPRAAIAITINSSVSRSQDQLHLHVDCLRADVARTLADYAPHVDGKWRPMTDELAGRRYFVRRLDGDNLDGGDPFKLLADDMPGAARDMGHWGLAAAPALFDGKPGFVLLTDQAGLEAGGHAEDLQDHDCAILK